MKVCVLYKTLIFFIEWFWEFSNFYFVDNFKFWEQGFAGHHSHSTNATACTQISPRLHAIT